MSSNRKLSGFHSAAMACLLVPTVFLTACVGSQTAEHHEPEPLPMLSDVLEPETDSSTAKYDADDKTPSRDSHTTDTEESEMTVMVLEDLPGYPAFPQLAQEVREPEPETRAAQETSLTPPSRLRFHFGFDSARVAEEDHSALRAHARFLRAHPEFIVQVTGHTDTTGADGYNLRLSRQRANAIAEFLKNEGVGAHQIRISARGSQVQPDELTKAADLRRVELDYRSRQLASGTGSDH